MPPRLQVDVDATSTNLASIDDEQRHFVDVFEAYLDQIYSDTDGRRRLTNSILAEIAARCGPGPLSVLDCAAGTGFPALDLAVVGATSGLRVHCTDSDPLMLEKLSERATSLGVSLDDLRPAAPGMNHAEQSESLLYSWSKMPNLETRYDYVMCRGNSITYADTWTGSSATATIADIGRQLIDIATCIKPGGWLHVDAPQALEFSRRDYPAQSFGDKEIEFSEQVEEVDGQRKWTLTVTIDGRKRETTRMSTALDVKLLRDVLERDVGMKNIEQVQLEGERSNFGVLLAQKA